VAEEVNILPIRKQDWKLPKEILWE